jgi:hypothetical protein
MRNWKHIATIFDNEKFLLNGVNICNFEWKLTNKTVNVKDPIYNQSFIFNIYKIQIENEEIEFVAGEYSNCVYGIYLKNKKSLNL